MKKVRSNASWNKLTPKQREKLDRWLFEESLSYADILIKASRELGYKGSESSLRRYYGRRRQERLLTDLKELGKDMMEVRALDQNVDADVSRKASMQLLGAYLFRVLREAPEKVKEWAPVAHLLVQNDHNEALRSIKGEDQKIRREALAFAKEKYQIDMAEQALDALPELQELAHARRDPQTKRYEENARLNRIRRMMFGQVWEVQPESPQEAAEMLTAKREREARHAAEEEAVAERERVEKELGGPQPPTPSSQYYEEYVEAKAEAEEKVREREKAYRQSQAQAAEAERAEQEESKAQNEARAAEAKKAEQEKRRKYREARARFEEMRESCGWQELSRPPGWKEMDGWKDAPLEWDLESNEE